MTTSNGKSAIESTEQSLPDYRQDSTEEMHEAFEREIISISTGYSPYAWIFFTAWNAAIATKQEELAQANATIASTKLTYQEKDLLEARIRGLELSNGLYINEIASKQEELAQAEEQIRKLKSELEDANAMNLLGTQQCIYTDVSNALKQANATIAALETKELELLGVIEQMRKAIYACVHCDYQGYYKGRHHIEQGQEALALTPDIAALKETFAPLAGSKTQHLTGSTD